MLRNTFSLEVFAFGERNQAIEKCRNSLLSSGGDLLDFKMFSDMVANFIIEIPEKNILTLQSTLDDLNWKTELKLLDNPSRTDCLPMVQGTMSVTFASGTGDKKDVIPAVPG
jgi:hypothetical protein